MFPEKTKTLFPADDLAEEPSAAPPPESSADAAWYQPFSLTSTSRSKNTRVLQAFPGSPSDTNVPPSTHPRDTQQQHTHIGVIVGATVACSVVVVAALSVFFVFWRFKKRQPKGSLRLGSNNNNQHDVSPARGEAIKGEHAYSLPEDFKVVIQPTFDSKIQESSGSMVSSTSTQSNPPNRNGTYLFTYDELKEATNGFSNTNLIGKGGYGFVYKGVLSNGKFIAVKQLKVGSFQGEREFMAEVETISHIHHRNLISLVGYSIDGGEKLLVYEYLSNNSLAYHLNASTALTILAWDTRMQIALGSAKGISYLHEDCDPKIIHRDIKATNILLDSKFKAKVSDFGLAKFLTEAETHVTTRIMGTLGYLAPEYASSGRLTEKSDVYSFGIVLIEIISGRGPIDLVDWARPLLDYALEYGIYDELVDPKLGNHYNNVEMGLMVACAEACIHPYAIDRPQMIQVARVLEGVMPPTDLKKKYR